MVGMQTQGLPVSYINSRNDKINAVTLQDANRVAGICLILIVCISSSWGGLKAWSKPNAHVTKSSGIGQAGLWFVLWYPYREA